MGNFEGFLKNVFGPVMDATLNPKAHPELARFLEHVVGFDSVDDEERFIKILEYIYHGNFRILKNQLKKCLIFEVRALAKENSFHYLFIWYKLYHMIHMI